MRPDQPGAGPVVVGGVLGRGDFGLADVDPDRYVGPVAGQPVGQFGGAVIVEPHPVEQGAVGGQPEQPRSRVARLGVRGDRTDLGVAETQCAPSVEPGAVFVEAGGQAQRAGEMHPEYRAGQHRVDRRQPTAQSPPHRPAAVTPRSAANTSPWMRSAGTRNSNRRSTAYTAGRSSRVDSPSRFRLVAPGTVVVVDTRLLAAQQHPPLPSV